ncbi:ubiquinol-cytochrome c reductase iron-sulfur subunit [Ruegeria halocynthiae]|uniref:Ubiquinol-cytochrome c reductase iron-sulfur subunit n=1 Tax=Ruegeria halocynthiae TaxID=985054 RepID=A0A1H3C7L3_9RHOB|nr:ubiquinol cytochrome C oxidoreductase [Ruegeria halocynthiae]SDX50142.1 ubiquinol-cytochrome c reductase iron-sulfur subunit [Ruegeria halocynthiae]
MKSKSVFLCYLAASTGLVTVAIGLYFLLASMQPTADVVAKYQTRLQSISVEDWEPGEVRTFIFYGMPVLLWRRDLKEIATAMAQFDPETSKDEWSEVLENGALEFEIGRDAYTNLEWFIASPINVGGYGCVVLAKAGDYDGFFDPCQSVHFDMWGRPKQGPSMENLVIPPAQFTEDRRSILFDLSKMPSTR